MIAWARFTGPRFAAYAPLVERLAALPAWPSIAALDALLADHLRRADLPGVRLVEQAPAPRRRGAPIDPASLYEVRIGEHREVPSRPGNLHDLCNALVWATFPRGKWALSVRLAQHQRTRATGAARLPGARAPAHDRLALLDEGGLLVTATHDVVFGHAILEHAALGRTDVRAAPFALPAPTAPHIDAIDRALAAALDAGGAVAPGPGVAIDDARLLR